jgi:plastocyanin
MAPPLAPARSGTYDYPVLSTRQEVFMRARAFAVFSTLLLAGLLACGGGSDSSGPVCCGPKGAVTVGPGVQFTSRHNNSNNPAVDTIAVGDTITWTWQGSLPHSVRSTGSPSFTSSGTQTTGEYKVKFTAAGTYTYDCAVHGASMTGRVVVQ